MCPCTSENPFECEARHGRSACSCPCHRHWKAPATASGPRQPIDERDAEIARLQARIAVLEEAVQAASVYLTNSTPSNAVKLNDALRQAREEKQA